ncbi:MAG: hypothetical protein HOV71_19095 [Hamadaea sp.]|nr:hypothetical protein [Hamadaea sp.]NUR50238.1 hypothetical protein [Hamadaea sp.]
MTDVPDLSAALSRAQRKLEVASARIAQLEVDREAWRQRHQATVADRDRQRSVVDAIIRSRSYRLARAVALLRNDPTAAVSKVVRRASARFARTKGAGGAVASPAAIERTTQPRTTGGPVLSDSLAIHAYVAMGFSLETLRDLARVVEQCATATGTHVPLIITDVPWFSLLRDTGLAIEYVPSRSSWEAHRSEPGWEVFRDDRLSHLLRLHQPTKVFFLSDMRPPTLSELIAVSARP